MSREIAPTLIQLSAINADGSRRNIQPAEVRGRFVTARTATFAVLIFVYVALPFVHVGGHPAVQLDIAERRFYLFGSVFNAQDFWRVVFLLLAFALGLFFVTAWYGRVWCGWACPQTVFLEGVYRRIERLIEGSREQRLRLAAAPWSARKVLLTIAKHGAYAGVSLVLAHVALAFFVSLPTTLQMVRRSPAENWTAFLWVGGLTGALYFNFAWFREQLCIVICPYGRLQSAMLDRDSIIIGYDRLRGEPRGKITRAERAGGSSGKGDCVDCLRCVHVCPTGIDIRNGSQLECVGCARCIDACDDVMERLDRPRGLIRHDSLAGLEQGPKRVVRPRLIAYAALFGAAVFALVVSATTRTPFEANLLRKGIPYELDAGAIRNQLELHLVNKNPGETVFHVSAASDEAVKVSLPMGDVHVGSLEHARVPVVAAMLAKDFHGPFDLRLDVEDSASGQRRLVIARFLGPPAGH